MASKRFRKITASILSVMLVVNVPSMGVLADDLDTETDETVVEETVAEEPEEEVVEEEPAVVETFEETEEVEPAEEDSVEIPAAPDLNISLHIDTSDLGPDLTEDEMFEGYFFTPTVNDPMHVTDDAVYTRAFAGVDLYSYTYMETEIAKIAAGKQSSTVITLPVTEDLGNTFYSRDYGAAYFYDFDGGGWTDAIEDAINSYICDTTNVVTALLCNHPYEMYWYDKVTGMSIESGDISGIKLYDEADGTQRLVMNFDIIYSLSVAQAYRGGSQYTFNTSKAAIAREAAANARAIVDANQYKTDLQKLTAYKEAICSLVDYNYSAAGGGASYGDPWQLVWVFDGDESTKVVCEGYSKAFKFLCDMTNFRRDISCIVVSGDCGGGHMWNVVNMDDGRNYMVDVTNSDDGAVGSGGGLFIVPYTSGSVNSGYKFSVGRKTMTYIYDTKILNCFETWELMLSEDAYVEPAAPIQAPAQIKGRSLALEGYIVLNFMLDLPEQFVSDPNARIKMNNEISTVPAPEADGRYRLTYNLAAAQINDDVTLTLLDGNGNKYLLLDKDGNNVTGGYTFSAHDYIELANAMSTNTKLKTMLQYMAEYGKYAQINFDYDADDVVLDSTIASEINAVTANTLIGYRHIEARSSGSTISYRSSTLSLESATSINHNFVPASGKTVNDYIFKVDGQTVTTSSRGQFRLEVVDGVFRLSINNIGSGDLNKAYVVTIEDKATGNLQLSLQYSALSYAYRVMEKCGGTDNYLDLQNTVRALYLYFLKADAYFNN